MMTCQLRVDAPLGSSLLTHPSSMLVVLQHLDVYLGHYVSDFREYDGRNRPRLRCIISPKCVFDEYPSTGTANQGE